MAKRKSGMKTDVLNMNHLMFSSAELKAIADQSAHCVSLQAEDRLQTGHSTLGANLAFS